MGSRFEMQSLPLTLRTVRLQNGKSKHGFMRDDSKFYFRDNATIDSLLFHILRDDAEFLHTPSIVQIVIASMSMESSIFTQVLPPYINILFCLRKLHMPALAVVSTLPLTRHIAQRIAAPTNILSTISRQGNARGIGLDPESSACRTISRRFIAPGAL